MRVVADLDFSALQANLGVVRAVAPKSKVMAMIKANAYGHGLLPIGMHIGADYLGVTALSEARLLREAGVNTPIVLMSGVHTQTELDLLCELEIATVIYHEAQLLLLQRYHGHYRLPVWFKIDTGMHRLGAEPASAVKMLRQLEALSHVDLQVIMTHLACADDLHHSATLAQFEAFDTLTRHWSYPKSVANSAALFYYPDFHYDIVRPGLALYGASPCQDKSVHDLKLRPVMEIHAPVIAIKQLQKGEGVGYGFDWRAPDKSVIATVAMGYGDGYPQHCKHGYAWINSQKCPVVGRVSMDFLSLDVTHLTNISLLNEASFWGKESLVNDHAKALGMSVYALLTGIMERVPRRNINLSFAF
jgi:alanine racemase